MIFLSYNTEFELVVEKNTEKKKIRRINYDNTRPPALTLWWSGRLIPRIKSVPSLNLSIWKQERANTKRGFIICTWEYGIQQVYPLHAGQVTITEFNIATWRDLLFLLTRDKSFGCLSCTPIARCIIMQFASRELYVN